MERAAGAASHHPSAGQPLHGPDAASATEPRRSTIWLDRPFAAGMTAALPGTPPIVRPVPRLAPPPRQRQSEAAARIAAFDDLGLAAIVCEASGRLLACSRAAATVLRTAEILARSADRLVALDPQCHARLRAAIVRCGTAEEDEPEQITLALVGTDGLPARVDVAPLRHAGGGCCLILVSQNRSGGQAVQQLVSAFGLTRAEAEVAIDLAHGLSARDIAARRSASSDTVRKQTQSIFQKLDVSKATRLSFILGPFLR